METFDNIQSFKDYLTNFKPELSFFDFTINIVIAGILGYLLRIVYVKFGSSLNNRSLFSKNFVVLTMTTMFIITIVKSSLALSLGLVGALSIVRFRAAIKEPEELVYLFFIIGIGLANGANQFLVSIICTFFIVIVLFIKKFFDNKKNEQNLSDSSVNVLQIEIADKNKNIEEIINVLKPKTLYLKLKSYRIEKNISQYVFWFDVKKNDINSFIKITENLKKEQENISIHVYSRTGIYE